MSPLSLLAAIRGESVTVEPSVSDLGIGRAGERRELEIKIKVALTSYLGVSGKNWFTNDGIFFRDSRVRLGDIRDGTSNTLLAGERPPSPDYQFGWW